MDSRVIRSIISILLAIMIAFVFMPAMPEGKALAATDDSNVTLSSSELFSLGQRIGESAESFRSITQEIINISNDLSDGTITDEEHDTKTAEQHAKLDEFYPVIYSLLDEATDAGMDMSESKVKLQGLYSDYLDNKIGIDDFWIPSYNEIYDDQYLVNSYYNKALEREAAEEEKASEPEPKYTPGKNITMSKLQSKLKVDATWIMAEGYFDDDTRILAIKKDKSLWDLSRNNKITTNVKSMFSNTDSDQENGIFVIKTNGKLYYMYKKSGKWRSKKLLSGVKEFANSEFMDNDHPPYILVDGVATNIDLYVVKTNGNMMKGRIKFNSNVNRVLKSKWTKVLSSVDHAYVSSGMDSKYNETLNLFAIKKNGRLYAWGSNSSGEAGNGKTKKVKKPRLVMKNVDKFRWVYQVTADDAISPVGGCTCFAIKKNGDLYGWGEYSGINTIDGDYPDGYFDNTCKPLKLLTNVSMMDADRFNKNFIALTRDGVLWAWGHKAGGKEIYDGNHISWDFYDDIGMTKIANNVIAADTNGNTVMFLKKDKTLWYQGFAPGSKYKSSIDKAKKLTSKVNAFKQTTLWGTYVLKTNGYLYGTDYTYKKYYGKLRKLGTGFPK